MKYRAVRGMHDILPEESWKWQYLEEKIRTFAHRYGFREIRTPMLEYTEVFQRGVGEGTDIVEKEMYTFLDRGGRSLSLRPEGTAAVVRAYLEHNLGASGTPVKLYYIAPLFRYDRPQRGRYRQHHQFGAEILGTPDPAADAEVLSLPIRLMQDLGLREVEVHLNSVGDAACRPRYIAALRDYFGRYLDELCPDCRRRYDVNPLRILDCKEERCHRLAREAPTIFPYLCQECRTHFEGVQEHLDWLGIRYTIDPFIVRGLDYYTRTAAEVYSGKLGAQNAMFGGGRYDGLASQLGGPPVPGVGFGMGIERLLLVLEEEGIALPREDGVDVFVATTGKTGHREAFQLLDQMRQAGLRADGDPSHRELRAQMKLANRLGARYAVILGEEELRLGMATVRNMASGDQERLPLGGLIEALRERIQKT
ncbi:MAG: histidine--tRNA ligase [Armatimonadota bacterium]|nr:histidine--tRNA ligase [Armatimonadota bacterium]MDR5702801.1 histidine--tRNA ligase [Armatimonadota bacterium]